MLAALPHFVQHLVGYLKFTVGVYLTLVWFSYSKFSLRVGFSASCFYRLLGLPYTNMPLLLSYLFVARRWYKLHTQLHMYLYFMLGWLACCVRITVYVILYIVHVFRPHSDSVS